MGRFERSYVLAKQSFAVLRTNPQLMLFPIVSAFMTIVVAASFWIPTFFLMGGTSAFKDGARHMPPLYYVVTFCFYLVTSFIVIFFNSGLVSCAYRSLTGQPANFQDGMRAASSRIGPILGWTLIAATIGWALRMVSERAGLIGRIVIGIIGIAWSILTYFVIPVLVVEGVSPTQAVRRSGEMIRKTWGESLIGAGGIGLFLFLLGLAPIPFLIIAGFTAQLLIILPVVALSLLYWLVLSVMGASMSGIYSTALYVYASTGREPQGFSPDTFQTAFLHKKTMSERFSGWGGR